MKKHSITYLLLVVTNLFCISFYAQKTQVQPSKSTPKVEKTTTAVDTIKKGKEIALESNDEIIDTLIVEKGKFKLHKKNAHASYYANKFNGRRTASGKKFNNNAMTCAHKKLPFGTKLKVTNEVNGKSVYVEVTDRGPYVKGRELDLSRRAFMEIAHNKGSGAVNVTISILQK
jgi:rare lipoprotein A